MRDGSGWFCSLSLSRSLPCFYPNYFLKIIFELFSVMTQNYLFSQEIANVLPGFVSVVLLFIPWSSIPHSVPYGVDVAEGFLLPSDTFNGIFALPLFFSIPHYSLLLLFSFSHFLLIFCLLYLFTLFWAVGALQHPCPSNCFWFSNPSQEASRSEERPEGCVLGSEREARSQRWPNWPGSVRDQYTVDVIRKYS